MTAPALSTSLAVVLDALDAPDRPLGPDSALTTVDGRLARVGAYESYLASRRSVRSRQTMTEALDRIARLLDRPANAIPWHRFTYAETNAVVGALAQRGYAPDTVRLTLAGLKGVLRQAVRLGLMAGGDYATAVMWDPVRGDRLPAGRDLSVEEIDKLIAYARSMGPAEREWPESAYGAFLGAVLALLLGVGTRATETGLVLVDAYDPSTCSLRLLRKGSKEAIVSFGPDVVAPLNEWLAVRAELAPSVPTLIARVLPDGSVSKRAPIMKVDAFEYLCEVIAEAAGIAPFTPHDCRRTFATRSLDMGIDLGTVQRLMSHERVETTTRYDKRGQKKDAEARAKVNLFPWVKT